MDKQQALHSFWSQFGTAYEENSVPTEATHPYITYQKLLGSLDEPVYPMGTVWTRSSSWSAADGIVNEINDRLKNGGQILKLDEGRLWIERGTPFSQARSDTDRSIKAYTINLSVEFLTE